MISALLTLQAVPHRVNSSAALGCTTAHHGLRVHGGRASAALSSIQQSMLIVLLLCVSPAFEQVAHGHHNPAVRATALQDTQRVRRLHKALAQLVRWASERQARQPDHARETASHVEIGAFRHVVAVTRAGCAAQK